MIDELNDTGGARRLDHKQHILARTLAFGRRIVRMYKMLPNSAEAQVIGRQVLRSGTSVGAHYREAIRARSKREFASKMHLGAAELEETTYWLALLVEAEIFSLAKLRLLRQEADELLRIFVASAKTAEKNLGGKLREDEEPYGP